MEATLGHDAVEHTGKSKDIEYSFSDQHCCDLFCGSALHPWLSAHNAQANSAEIQTTQLLHWLLLSLQIVTDFLCMLVVILTCTHAEWQPPLLVSSTVFCDFYMYTLLRML